MTKRRTQARRTRPLDRDGDGRDGGSLPGNQTAPMADAGDQTPPTVQPSLLKPGSSVLRHKDGRTGTFVEPEDDGRLRVQSLKGRGFWTFDPAECELVASDDQADAANPGDPNKPNDGPPNSDATPPAQPETEQPAEWTRDNKAIANKLDAAGVRDHDEHVVIPLATITQWTDEDARSAEAFADAMLAPGSHTDTAGDERHQDGSPIELPSVLSARHVLPRERRRIWTRNDAEILEDLQLMDEGWSGTVETLTLQTVKEWSDDQAKDAQAYAASIVGLTPERRAPAPEFLQPFLISKPAAEPPTTTDAAPEATEKSWVRDDFETAFWLADLLNFEPEDWESEATMAKIAAWSDEQCREADDWTMAATAAQDRNRPEMPAFIAEAFPSSPAERNDVTFTAEEIAAGKTSIVQEEGEASAAAADVATQIPADDPLVTIDTDTAPIAVRLRELQVLIGARRLYKSADGYSASYGAPFIDEATVKGWIKAGLAIDVPSAGNAGGVRLTAQARSVATRLRQQQQAEAA